MAAQAPGRGTARRMDAERPRGTAWRVVLGLALGAAVAACSPQVRHHGYTPDEARLAGIEVGRASREDVAAALGRPGTTGLMSQDAWFYVSSRWEQRPPRPAAEVAREVLAVSFDSRGLVRNIERFGLEDGQPVVLSRRVTDTTVQGQGLLAQLLRNVGRFSPDQLVD